MREQHIEFNFEHVAFKMLLETFILNCRALQETFFQYSNTQDVHIQDVCHIMPVSLCRLAN